MRPVTLTLLTLLNNIRGIVRSSLNEFGVFTPFWHFTFDEALHAKTSRVFLLTKCILPISYCACSIAKEKCSKLPNYHVRWIEKCGRRYKSFENMAIRAHMNHFFFDHENYRNNLVSCMYAISFSEQQKICWSYLFNVIIIRSWITHCNQQGTSINDH